MQYLFVDVVFFFKGSGVETQYEGLKKNMDTKAEDQCKLPCGAVGGRKKE